jgi:eukaryotic-like serine/threonine-protein kinase
MVHTASAIPPPEVPYGAPRREPPLTDLVDQLRAALAGRYLLQRELGGGGMSRVFLAEETALGRKVVIKVLPPDLAAALSADRFRREIQLAASLQHPHIVPLLAAGDADGLLYYTMPLVEGESLRARLAREGELPVPEAIRILRDVADALSYAHRHSVVHRDIKPDNVLLSDHHALVTDFGVAKALDEAARHSSLTATGLALGTPTYMAPEQAAADPHTDHRADIYALGVLGYEILAGRPPFVGPSPQAIVAAQLTQPAQPLAQSRPSVPPAVAALVMRCLEKRPADRWQNAAELLDAIEALAPPVGATSDAPTALPPARQARGRLYRRALALAGLLALVVAVVVWSLVRQSREAAPLDGDLVAVAPFDVPDPRLALWREGLVDLLSRNLDGAGPLRSVPPTTVIRRWRGRADRLSASELGRRTGARLIVFGNLIGAGPDSVRLTATALDASSGRRLAELELRDDADRMDRLADSVTLRLLRELGRSRKIEVFRTGSLGSTSLPALKAFLQGEQWFRRAAWDSALSSYEQAIALDSAFPLPLRRASQVIGWQRTAFDSAGEALALRAGALNRGLSPRDSLLVTADSVFALVYATIPLTDGAVIRRAHAIAAELTRRYPDDLEAWFTLGEAQYHFGSPVGAGPRQALESFQQAIAIDSSFAPAYIHPVELALWVHGPDGGERFAAGYLTLQPTDGSASGIALAQRILRASQSRPSDIEQLIRSASPGTLIDAAGALRRSPDSAEALIAVGRALVDASPGDARWLTPDARKRRLGGSLLYRGHVREGAGILYATPDAPPAHLVEAALLSATPPESAGPVFRRWVDQRLASAVTTLPWWAARRDSAAIHKVRRNSAALADSAREGIPRGRATYTAEAALAYLTLLRGDTAAAIRQFEALPDTLCAFCYFQRLTLAQLLSAKREDRKAFDMMDGYLLELLAPSEVLWTLERARVAERLGERAAAARDYQYVADIWRRADPQLQPYVEEAKEGLMRVSAEVAGEP